MCTFVVVDILAPGPDLQTWTGRADFEAVGYLFEDCFQTSGRGICNDLEIAVVPFHRIGDEQEATHMFLSCGAQPTGQAVCTGVARGTTFTGEVRSYGESSSFYTAARRTRTPIDRSEILVMFPQSPASSPR